MFIKKEFEEKMRKKSVTIPLAIVNPFRSASRPKKISTYRVKRPKSIQKSDLADFLV